MAAIGDDPVQFRINGEKVAAKQMSRSSTSIRNDDESIFTPVMDFRKLMAMIGAFYWFIMIVFLVPTACVATCFCLVPIMLFSMKYFNKLEHMLCFMVNEHWCGGALYTGLTIEEFGDDVTSISDKRALCLANHLGLVDHFILMTSFHNKPSLAGKYLWVIYNIWKMTPLGVLWQTHGNFFINGGQSKRQGVLQQFRDHLINNYWKFDYGWITMYPEGSRLYLIRNSEKQFAEKHGIEPFKNCAHPRTGACHAVLSVCGPTDKSLTKSHAGNGPPIEYIVDVTLGYPKGKVPGLGEAMVGEWPASDSNVSVHYSIHKVQPEWSDEETLKQWLYKQYEKKDKLLEDYYRTGRFPGQGRPMEYSIIRNVCVQLFWITLYSMHYYAWIKPLGIYFSSFIY